MTAAHWGEERDKWIALPKPSLLQALIHALLATACSPGQKLIHGRGLRVEVTPPHGQGKLSVRTRTGYYAKGSSTAIDNSAPRSTATPTIHRRRRRPH